MTVKIRVPFVPLLLVSALVAPPAAAQESPDSTGAARAGRAGMHGGALLGGITEAQREALLSGAGLGAGRLAMTNGYPGPRHVLEMADELELTDGQRERLGTLFAERKASFVRLGQRIVEKEDELAALFAAGAPETGAVEALTREIGDLQGQLRAGHLNAHVLTWELLDESQREELTTMRGRHHEPGAGDRERVRQREHRAPVSES